MEEFTPNSHKFKEEQNKLAERPKVNKVIKGTAKTKKKSGFSKFVGSFISEDVDSIKSYVISDVLIPAAKKTISDIISIGTDMLLFGESGGNKKRSMSSRVSYRDYYDSRRRDDRPVSRTRSGYSYDDILFESRGEAEEVRERMDELIETYGVVSVADMYDLAGITCQYTDNNYGWTNIRNATVERVRDGWILKMPKALPLK